MLAKSFLFFRNYSSIILTLLYTSITFAQISVELKDQDKKVHVIGVEWHGVKYTDTKWAERLLGINELPITISPADKKKLVYKLLTTRVITNVDIYFSKTTEQDLNADRSSPQKHIMHIRLNEKWTTMPVLRVEYGGGTPLQVYGIYDTHVLGRKWTLGAELRRYGTDPFGGVAYLRIPNGKDGKGLYGLEVWKIIRNRKLYNKDRKYIADFETNSNKLRTQLLRPVTFFSNQSFTLGVDLIFEKFAKTSIVNKDTSQQSIYDKYRSPGKNTTQVSLLPTLIYDDMIVDNIQAHGLRAVFYTGPLLDGEHTGWVSETELFHYYLINGCWNICSHLFLGKKETDLISSLYSLGGLESIRGLPDGVIMGSQAAFANFEIRRLWKITSYTWLQTAGFYDIGSAANYTTKLPSQVESSFGMGLRIYVPHVTRLMVRFDYAVSTKDPSKHGFSIGMNQFFQPYTPL